MTDTDKLILAAKRADWMQVVLNQGPPCFAHYVDGDGTFCLRAERWEGHSTRGYPSHPFVSLVDLLVSVQENVAWESRECTAWIPDLKIHCGCVGFLRPTPVAPSAERAALLARLDRALVDLWHDDDWPQLLRDCREALSKGTP